MVSTIWACVPRSAAVNGRHTSSQPPLPTEAASARERRGQDTATSGQTRLLRLGGGEARRPRSTLVRGEAVWVWIGLGPPRPRWAGRRTRRELVLNLLLAVTHCYTELRTLAIIGSASHAANESWPSDSNVAPESE